MAHQIISELARICIQLGIDHAVISPGSRNAPLIIAFAKNPAFRCFSISDERSAGYFALGMARQLHKPVVLICTSGTAALNYAPALAEAFYQKIPLLALTADRPPEWIDQNDGQSIRQQNIYSSFIKKSFSLPVDTFNPEDLWHARRIISGAVNFALSGGHGPVHVNVPLREPLYTKQAVLQNDIPVIRITESTATPGESRWQSIREKWSSFNKKLIVCGFMNSNYELNRLLDQMSRNDEAVVIAENLSNLFGREFIDTPDPFLARLSGSDRGDFTPGLLVTIGGSVVSKNLKNYLREYKPSEHWHIDPDDLIIDTYRALTQNIPAGPLDFFSRVVGTGKNDPGYMKLARERHTGCGPLHNEFIRNAEFSDLSAYRSVFDYLPPGCSLHLANSTPVRYAQLFSSNPSLLYYSNRGVSGIDGCISSAAGAAMIDKRLTVLLSGDIAFIYDSSGLWNNQLTANLRIIVFNNDGGNIFKLIQSSPEVRDIEHFFETPHKVNLKALSEAFGLDHYLAGNKERLEEILQRFFEPKERAAVLEIKTSGTVSAKVFKQYFHHLSKQNEQ